MQFSRPRVRIDVMRLLGVACLAGAMQSAGAVYFSYDYSFDAAGSNFFDPGTSDGLARRTALETAGSFYAARINDSLTAIVSTPGGDSFTGIFENPDTGVAGATIFDLNVAFDEIIIIPGARDLGGSILAEASPASGTPAMGGFNYLVNAVARGQGGLNDVSGSNAHDFAPWGGTIAFDIDTNWHLAVDSEPPSPASPVRFDFLTVALHEFGHVLGVGTAASWDALVNGSNQFTGSASTALFGGNVPLQSSGFHWTENTMSTIADGPEPWLNGAGNQQETAFDPGIEFNNRNFVTDLDLAALTDIGWEISNPPAPVPLPAGGWLLAGGLGLMGLRRRRPSA